MPHNNLEEEYEVMYKFICPVRNVTGHHGNTKYSGQANKVFRYEIVKSILRSDRQRLIDEIEGMKAMADDGRYEDSDIGNSYWTGYNQALDDVITHLKK